VRKMLMVDGPSLEKNMILFIPIQITKWRTLRP
jgi:hypothetical protein